MTVSLWQGLPFIAATLDSSLVLASHSGSVGDVVVHKLTPLHQHQCVLVTFPVVVVEVERKSFSQEQGFYTSTELGIES